MKILQAVMLIFSLGMAGFAQPRHNRHAAPSDLMSTLLELDRTAAATNSDIGHLQIGKWKGGWKTAFTTSSSHKKKAGEAAESLQRNLQGALPGLIRAAINSRGDLAPTFKVYEDISLVCQTLGPLVDIAQQYGTKGEYVPLIIDYNSLAHLRRAISRYIQQRAVAEDGGHVSGYDGFSAVSSSSHGTLPRKIIVDDNVSRRRSRSHRKKKSTTRFRTVE